MKIRTLLIVFTALFLAMPANAQRSRYIVQKLFPDIRYSKPVQEKEVVVVEEADEEINPFANRKPVYYRDATRRNGWITGIDSIPESEALHLKSCYRFSNMNEFGQWTLVEALTENGKPNAGNDVYLYGIGETVDSLDNYEWMEKTYEICKWNYVYSSLKEGEQMMERAYNESGDMIYAFIPVQLNDSVVAGSYINDYGLPVNLVGGKGGSLVRLVRDRQGYDVTEEILDENGFVTRNSYGVFMLAFDNDEKGKTTAVRYCNVVGDPMYNNKGIQIEKTKE